MLRNSHGGQRTYESSAEKSQEKVVMKSGHQGLRRKQLHYIFENIIIKKPYQSGLLICSYKFPLAKSFLFFFAVPDMMCSTAF